MKDEWNFETYRFNVLTCNVSNIRFTIDNMKLIQDIEKWRKEQQNKKK